MAIFQANAENFDALIARDEVLVDFWAAWCGPCRMLAPVLDELADKVDIVKVNVDELPQLAVAFGVESIPTVVAFRGGKPLGRSVGVTDAASLLALLA